MLVLSRKKGESILIGDHIEITILDASSDSVKIGIKAPREIEVLRKELYESVVSMNQSAENSVITEADLLSQFSEIKRANTRDEEN